MSFLRRISTRHLLLLCVGVVAVVAGGTALAIAAGSGGAKPAAKALPVALRDALAAPAPAGVTAHVTFTNNLIDSGNVEGSSPLLSGADGRIWVSSDGHFRLELQSSGGDAQVVSDGKSFFVYDASANTVYRGQLPKQTAHQGTDRGGSEQPPTLQRIQAALAQLGKHAGISGATPGNLAGQPEYTVRLTPKQGGGLLGGAALAWDAARGVPLKLAVYARGHSTPVLELKATDISYGPVAAGDFAVSPPAGAKTVDLSPAKRDAGGPSKHAKPIVGLTAVEHAAGFKLAAPATLAGRPREGAHLLGATGDKPIAAVTYGRDLGAIVVLEQRSTGPARVGGENAGPLGRVKLPTVSIGGAAGQELDTALGTAIRFERGGVSYTVLGSVSPAVAQTAARGL